MEATDGVNARLTDPIILRSGNAPEIEHFLAERIYEFNSKATGYYDADHFSLTLRDKSGVIQAGLYGYTWGGCAYVSYLWVDESERGQGVGTALLLGAEDHAKSKGCTVIFLATHSFQAPVFYARQGYEQQSVLRDHPVGYSSLTFAKRLQTDAA